MAVLYGLAFTETALKSLESITPAKVRRQIRKRIKALASKPTPPGSKKLRGVPNGEGPVYRVRQGVYRILYAVRDNPNQIIVLDIGHRKDVYR